MSDLIKRSEVLKQLWLNQKDVVYIDKKECARRIEAIPPADAVEVVRCKECKHAHMTYGGDCKYCDMWKDDGDYCLELYLGGDFYCADGERKETDHE